MRKQTEMEMDHRLITNAPADALRKKRKKNDTEAWKRRRVGQIKRKRYQPTREKKRKRKTGGGRDIWGKEGLGIQGATTGV